MANRIVSVLLFLLLLPSLGCYNLVVVNVGVANKSAAAAPLPPEAYCLALISSEVNLASLPPRIAIEQRQYCTRVLQHQKGKK